jgi:translation initiation factor eIF-2B subunit alpha
VAAIRALAAVIRNCQATTMMELEIELKKASDSLKVSVILLLLKSFV